MKEDSQSVRDSQKFKRITKELDLSQAIDATDLDAAHRHQLRELQDENQRLKQQIEELKRSHAQTLARATGALSSLLSDLDDTPEDEAQDPLLALEHTVRRIQTQFAQFEERLTSVFSNMTDGLMIQDSHGAILACNKAAERILGVSSEQLERRGSADARWQAIHPDGTPFGLDQLPSKMALRTQQPIHDVVIGLRKPTGELAWINVHAIPLPASNSVLTTFADITGRKQNEEDLNFQAQLLRAVGQAVIATDLLGQVTYFNPAAERLYGWSAEEVLGKNILDVNVGTPHRKRAEEILQSLSHGGEWHGEFPVRRQDGSSFIAEVVDSPIRNARGELWGFAGVSQDITSRKEAEAALRDSEHLLRSIADGVPMCILRWDRDLRLVFANAAAEKLFGVSRGSLLGRSYRELMGEELLAKHMPVLEAALRGVSQSFEFSRIQPGGQVGHFWVQYVPHILDDVVTGILNIETDITLLKRGERLLTQLSEIVESASDSIVREDCGGVVQSWNPAAERLFGYRAEEMIGQPFTKLIPADVLHKDLAARERVLHGEPVEHYDTERVRKDGTRIEVEVTLSPVKDELGQIIGISRIAHNVSQRNLLQRQLQQASKMEVIGRLAGGVAHDFNNILQVMMLQIEHVTERPELPQSLRPAIAQLEQLTERAAKVTSQLLQFARKQNVQLKTVDLNQVLQQTTALLSRLLGERIDLRTTLFPSPVWVDADAGMIEQVILNLSINARDAMPNGGSLFVESSVVDWNDPMPAGFPEALPGHYVRLSVKDSGHGMSEEVLSHLFEPFFTTKSAGKGTGLGLAAVYGIIQQHRGFLTVDTTTGKGSTFIVYLPWSDKAPQETPPKSSGVTRSGSLHGILFVEDEDLLREVGVEMLASEGYRIWTAANGQQALAVFEQESAAIDLLITDIVMPGGISGLELGQILRKKKEDLSVILMSGYSEEIVTAENSPHAHIEFIAKPFRYQELLQLIRNSLGAP